MKETISTLKELLVDMQPSYASTVITTEVKPWPGSSAWLRQRAAQLEAEAKALEAHDALLLRARKLVKECEGE